MGCLLHMGWSLKQDEEEVRHEGVTAINDALEEESWQFSLLRMMNKLSDESEISPKLGPYKYLAVLMFVCLHEDSKQ